MEITRQTFVWINILLFISLLLDLIPCSAQTENLDISSFDYIRLFGESLELGDCPSRYIKKVRGKPIKRGCYYQMDGQQSSSVWPINYSTNIRVKTPEALLKMLYLCDGKAATYLGLLHKGDCYATELVNRVRFTPKSYVRIYLTYSRPYTDRLIEDNELSGPVHRYMDKFYLSAKTVGSLEAIVLEVSYNSKVELTRLNIPDGNLTMSKTFALMSRATKSLPRKTKVIRLSTAHRVLDVKRYRGSESKKVDKLLKEYEADIWRTVVHMQHNHTAPHYSYTFKTFVEGPRVGMLVSDASLQRTSSNTWENITALEVRLKGTLSKGKSVKRKCRQNMTVPACKQLNAIYRKIKTQVRSVHRARAIWFKLDESKRTSKLATTSREAKINAKSFTKMIRAYKKMLRQRKNG